VFVDAVWANVLVFAVGQAFAWLYVRSGRFWLGAGATIALWVAADWWLVGRYLLGASPAEQSVPLLLLQATAIATTVAFVWALVRRRQGRADRDQRHRKAIQHMLAGDHDGAAEVFRQLVWSDGWDAAAWVGLGDALRRAGDGAKARRSYARAGAVDLTRQFADLLAHRQQLLERQKSATAKAEPKQPAGKAKKTAIASKDPETAKGSKTRHRKRATKARSAG